MLSKAGVAQRQPHVEKRHQNLLLTVINSAGMAERYLTLAFGPQVAMEWPDPGERTYQMRPGSRRETESRVQAFPRMKYPFQISTGKMESLSVELAGNRFKRKVFDGES